MFKKVGGEVVNHVISIIVEGMKITYILINIGCLTYGAINSIFIRKAGLEHINISIRKLIEIRGKKNYINKIIKIKIDIDRHK